MSPISLLALVIFPLLMAFAAFSDLFTMRISNKLVLTVIVAFFALALFVGLPLEVIGMHLACAAGVLVVALVFFNLGWIGGGDGKLVAATALWLGLGGDGGAVWEGDPAVELGSLNAGGDQAALRLPEQAHSLLLDANRAPQLIDEPQVLES